MSLSEFGATFGNCLANPATCFDFVRAAGQASYAAQGGEGKLTDVAANMASDAAGTARNVAATTTGGGLVDGAARALSSIERIAMWAAIAFMVVLGLAVIAAAVYFTAPIMSRLL